AEDPPAFANAFLLCLRDRAARDDAARRGRTVAEEYDWKDLAVRFTEVVERVARGRRKGG
ncbi:MAG: hypothetical protein ACHBMF_10335, partial [Chromatiales bacterium]